MKKISFNDFEPPFSVRIPMPNSPKGERGDRLITDSKNRHVVEVYGQVSPGEDCDADTTAEALLGLLSLYFDNLKKEPSEPAAAKK